MIPIGEPEVSNLETPAHLEADSPYDREAEAAKHFQDPMLPWNDVPTGRLDVFVDDSSLGEKLFDAFLGFALGIGLGSIIVALAARGAMAILGIDSIH